MRNANDMTTNMNCDELSASPPSDAPAALVPPAAPSVADEVARLSAVMAHDVAAYREAVLSLVAPADDLPKILDGLKARCRS